MTAYEKLKKKEEVLIEASRRAESQDMKVMWLAKSRELQKKIAEMTIEEAEKEVRRRICRRDCISIMCITGKSEKRQTDKDREIQV